MLSSKVESTGDYRDNTMESINEFCFNVLFFVLKVMNLNVVVRFLSANYPNVLVGVNAIYKIMNFT